MKFKDALESGLEKKRESQGRANAREKRAARLKDGKIRQRRPLPAEEEK